MKKRQVFLLTFLSFIFSVTTSWAANPSIEKAIAIPFREKAEKITLFDKIHTNKGDLLHVEVVLSFQSGPKERTKYNSYQSVLETNGKYTLAYSDTGNIGPRSQHFSESMARKLSLSKFQYQIRKGKRNEILSLLKTPNLRLPKEDIWALKQLGIKVPSTVKELNLEKHSR
jgi:hypothetical protein